MALPLNARDFKITAQWAKGAATTIPPIPVSGQAYRNANMSAAQAETGTQYDTVWESSINNQKDFEATGMAMEVETYGWPRWSPLTGYVGGASFCLGTDGVPYHAKQDNGPNTSAGPQDPTTTTGYWQTLGEYVGGSGGGSGGGPSEGLGYALGEFYYFRNPTLKTGFQPAHGGLIASIDTKYPDAWDYLQTTEGRQLCITEAAWQAMTTATWATLANGTKIGWNGIGGAPFYVLDASARTLRLPDLRGMYPEAVGYDSLSVGGVHGDAIRNITGNSPIVPCGNNDATTSSPFGPVVNLNSDRTISTGAAWLYARLTFSASRTVPIANKNAPRAWGSLACCYLGNPTS